MSERHQFALFYKDLSSILVCKKFSKEFDFKDKDLWHRLIHVLRVKPGYKVVLFDNQNHIEAIILDSTFTKKDTIVICIEAINENKIIEPHITLMPCLLKKDAFEDVIYAAAQMGVNKIVPILSEKIQRSWLDEKDFDRLQNIMIAACEQSKNFVLPELCKPVKFQEVCNHCLGDDLSKIYFDLVGINFVEMLKEIQVNKKSKIVLLFGPEGGLTLEEEKSLFSLNFVTCALTSTILRAREAVIVGLGGVRSI